MTLFHDWDTDRASHPIEPPPDRDLAHLHEAERREVIWFRLSWRWRSQSRRCDREVYRQRIAVLRALRFAIEVLS